MKIKQNVLFELHQNLKAKAALVASTGKSYDTILRWVRENKPNGGLTTATAVAVISKELKINKNEILTKN
jgi:hypothetical protein